LVPENIVSMVAVPEGLLKDPIECCLFVLASSSGVS
jgi:hypothetical protein